MNYHNGSRRISSNCNHLSYDPYKQRQQYRNDADDDEYIRTLRSFIQDVEDSKKSRAKRYSTNASNNMYDPWAAISNNPSRCQDAEFTAVPNTMSNQTHAIGAISATNGYMNRPIPLTTVDVPKYGKIHYWIVQPLSKAYHYCLKPFQHQHHDEIPEYKLLEDGNDGAYPSFSDFSVYRVQFNEDENLFLNCATPNSSRFTLNATASQACSGTSTSSRYVYC